MPGALASGSQGRLWMIQIAACFLEYVAQVPVLLVLFEVFVAHVRSHELLLPKVASQLWMSRALLTTRLMTRVLKDDE